MSQGPPEQEVAQLTLRLRGLTLTAQRVEEAGRVVVQVGLQAEDVIGSAVRMRWRVVVVLGQVNCCPARP